MAMPIKNTPILKGKEARIFSDKINTNKYRPISKESYERIQNSLKNVRFKDCNF